MVAPRSVGGMPLAPQMFCREQIFVDSLHTLELKRLEKAVLRFANAGYDVDHITMLAFCRDYFLEILQERADRLAREEAWRLEWSGKKGQVKSLFDSIDADASGYIDLQELQTALKQLPNFFGYSEGEGAAATGGGGILGLRWVDLGYRPEDSDGLVRFFSAELSAALGSGETSFTLEELEELGVSAGDLSEASWIEADDGACYRPDEGGGGGGDGGASDGMKEWVEDQVGGSDARSNALALFKRLEPQVFLSIIMFVFVYHVFVYRCVVYRVFFVYHDVLYIVLFCFSF